MNTRCLYFCKHCKKRATDDIMRRKQCRCGAIYPAEFEPRVPPVDTYVNEWRQVKDIVKAHIIAHPGKRRFTPQAWRNLCKALAAVPRAEANEIAWAAQSTLMDQP